VEREILMWRQRIGYGDVDANHHGAAPSAFLLSIILAL